MIIIVKRLLAIALVIVMTFSFGACNKSEENKKQIAKKPLQLTPTIIFSIIINKVIRYLIYSTKVFLPMAIAMEKDQGITGNGYVSHCGQGVNQFGKYASQWFCGVFLFFRKGE